MLSADGVPVLMHDDTVDRTTNGSGAVSRLTLAELRRMRVGNEPVPLLTEALTRCAELGLWANVELKASAGGDDERLGEIVGRMLATEWNGHGVISSFSTTALMAARSQPSRHAYALLVGELPADWRRQVRDTGAMAVHANAACITADAIAGIRAAGLILACYTVNDRQEAERLLANGVSAVFTDRPDLWQTGQK